MTISQKIKLFFFRIFNFRKLKTVNSINEKLGQSIKDREVDRIILKGRIIKMTRKYLRINANSKYIPKDIKNETEIRERIIAEFGEQMEKFGVTINHKLELK